MSEEKVMDLTPKAPAPKKQKPNYKYLQDKDKEIVKGIFKFYEVPGATLEFVYGPIYKGDTTEKYTLVDGQVYSIPLGVAKHLNKNGWYPIHQHMQTEAGGHSMRIGQKVHRFGFQSLEFVDTEDLQMPSQVSSVLTAERVY